MAKPKSGSRIFAHEYGDELKDFFLSAQTAYASGEIQPQMTADGGHHIAYGSGHWYYDDLWYGGEPYSGITRIYHKAEICFTMNYFGRIMPYANRDEVMTSLMEALCHARPKLPWRGPHKFVAQNGMRYSNKLLRGELRHFFGEETILSARRNEKLYEMHYIGGIVNKD